MAIKGAGGEVPVATHPSFEPVLEVAKKGLAMVENKRAGGASSYELLVAMGDWNAKRFEGLFIPEAVVVPLEKGCEVFETVIKPYPEPKTILFRSSFKGPREGPHTNRRPAQPGEVFGGWVRNFSVERMFEVVFIGTTDGENGELTGTKSVSSLFKLAEGATRPYTPDDFVLRAALTLPGAPDLPRTVS